MLSTALKMAQLKEASGTTIMANEQIRADYSEGLKLLAQILRKTQGATDEETGKIIDVGGEVTKLREILDRQAAHARYAGSRSEPDLVYLASGTCYTTANTTTK